ncbi:MAG TPA: N-acetylmuramoyl-L-alanine amidase CwlD [Bacilli bacterium]|nr:N-acetylmuramoyl-L-alanine amidase CwlD [Bacilli bacterium]
MSNAGKRMPVWRFGVMVVFFIIGSLGLYLGIGRWVSEPSWTSTFPLKGQVIVIDAGHGGVDPGAVAESGLLEKQVTLPVSLKLRDMLQQAGAQVVMVRETDTDLAEPQTKGYSRRKNEDLRERARVVRESDADLLISLHCNAIGSQKWFGAQTFYNSAYEESEELAKKIQEALMDTTGSKRVAKAQDNIYLLKRSEKVGALVELGFLSNAEEAAKMKTDKYQDTLAFGVYKGILAYYAEQ